MTEFSDTASVPWSAGPRTLLREFATSQLVVAEPGAGMEILAEAADDGFVVLSERGIGPVGLVRTVDFTGGASVPAGVLVTAPNTLFGALMHPGTMSLLDLDDDPVGIVLAGPSGVPEAVVPQEAIDLFLATSPPGARRVLGPGGEAGDNRFPALPGSPPLLYRVRCREPGCGRFVELPEYNRLAPPQCAGDGVPPHVVRLR
ncbi:hypothetical protein [Streptomyces sp. NPDC088812]|uniref:hypothetical protein n=1 Tax=Streptomyces sp. NPDC088812 TaxID=3365905 RepID=UPI0037F3DA8A